MEEWIFYLICAVSLVGALLSLMCFIRSPRSVCSRQDLELLRSQFSDESRATRTELASLLNDTLKSSSNSQINAQTSALRQIAEMQDRRLADLESRLKSLTVQTEQQLGGIRQSLERQMGNMQQENNRRLDQMRQTVDEKLQKTLDEKLARSFGLVNERLEQVYKGLGEMQTLASGVGDLKKVLSNVKTRGILGEIQLGAILSEILAPEQYAENVATKKGSLDRVEYAVRMPAGKEGSVWLPIDAKFPADTYNTLLDAYDTGDSAAIEAAGKALESRIRSEAKDIHDKYIHVPETTEFGILFLPVEGLYAEVVRRGMVERLQNEFRVNIAGPTTMAALLNSLQMGFKTLAIQKRSSEVWEILGGVKQEFENFAEILTRTQNRLSQASDELEKLVGVRTRQIQRKLKSVTALPADFMISLPQQQTAELDQIGDADDLG
ncbi:MAG: DNA recombination protein RmuC [Pygmaiobacter massiliensis]|nr:DNA recombination protein RmuC [Pygmaiobacter massiliensis]